MPGEIPSEIDGRHRRGEIILFVEGLLVLVTFGLLAAKPTGVLVFVLVGLLLWHLAAISIGTLYLIRNGIVMSLVPLFPSAESRAFRKELRQRPDLDDETFYRMFYEGSEIPKAVVVRLRRRISHIDMLIDRVIPSDKFYLLVDDLDFADVMWLAEREFGVRFAKSDYGQVDGTLDNLIRLVQKKIGSECPT